MTSIVMNECLEGSRQSVAKHACTAIKGQSAKLTGKHKKKKYKKEHNHSSHSRDRKVSKKHGHGCKDKRSH